MHSARRELASARTAHPPIRGRSVRIGLARDASRLLRFYLRGCPFVSGPPRIPRIRRRGTLA